MTSRIFINVSMKVLLVKVVAFMVPWSISLYFVHRYYPACVDVEKLVTTVFANTVTFLVAYVLTMIGFRYSSKDKERQGDKV